MWGNSLMICMMGQSPLSESFLMTRNREEWLICQSVRLPFCSWTGWRMDWRNIMKFKNGKWKVLLPGKTTAHKLVCWGPCTNICRGLPSGKAALQERTWGSRGGGSDDLQPLPSSDSMKSMYQPAFYPQELQDTDIWRHISTSVCVFAISKELFSFLENGLILPQFHQWLGSIHGGVFVLLFSFFHRYTALSFE